MLDIVPCSPLKVNQLFARKYNFHLQGTKINPSKKQAQKHMTSRAPTSSESVSMSWYRAPLWDLRPDITSCPNVAVWNLRLVSVGCPLWREDGSVVCSVSTQWSESRRTRNHTLTVSSETPPTWRARSPYLYPPGRGWPSYTPGHWVPFTSTLTTRRATVEVFNLPPNLEGQVPVYISLRNRVVQSKVKVTLRPTVSHSLSKSWCLIYVTLEGLQRNEFQSDIRKVTLRRSFLCCNWEGCMWSMQCNVEFGHQLSICSGTKKNLGKPFSSQNQSQSLYGWQSVSQSDFLGVEPIVDVWPDIASFWSVWVWNVLSWLCGAPSLTRGRVCPL
jgi:hypothetical protein